MDGGIRTPLQTLNYHSLSSLHSTSPIISQVGALTCSDTAHPSSNSTFFLETTQFQTLTINLFKY